MKYNWDFGYDSAIRQAETMTLSDIKEEIKDMNASKSSDQWDLGYLRGLEFTLDKRKRRVVESHD